MDRHDFIARTTAALEGLDPASIDTFYIDRDGYEVDYWRPPQPDDFDELPRDDQGRVCVTRAIGHDWESDHA